MSFADDIRRNAIEKTREMADPNDLEKLAVKVFQQTKELLMLAAKSGKIENRQVNGGLFKKKFIEVNVRITELTNNSSYPKGTMYQFTQDGIPILELCSNDPEATKRFFSIIKKICRQEDIYVELTKGSRARENWLIFRVFL